MEYIVLLIWENFIQKEGSRIEIVMQRYRLTHLESILASFRDGSGMVEKYLGFH